MKKLLAAALILTFVTSARAGKKLDPATAAKADKMFWDANAAQGEKDYDRMFALLEDAAGQACPACRGTGDAR